MGFVVVILALVAINVLPNINIYENFILGLISALDTVAMMRYTDSQAAGLFGAICLGVVMFPLILYLFLNAAEGLPGMSGLVSSGALGNNVVFDLIAAIPSTFIGGIGAWTVESYSA